jgi:8-oxo-dGTP pyrophosphatase MutT (NUDIX family)
MSFTAADLRSRAAAGLGGIGVCAGEAALNPHYVAADPATLKPAAVLVPIIDRAGEATVLFTVRTAHLAAHAAEIAFPGGKIEAFDASPEAAALREAEEEIGLDPGRVDILGRLDSWRTGTGYQIEPVIGVVPASFVPAANPAEVVETFEAPLRFVMTAENFFTSDGLWRDANRVFHAISYRDRHIWGATAGILRHMQERLYR